ncbi:hypothetical protein B0H14DRAFT_2583553 [Mycena olivaceomarginata]|nr:hypothetical protein B0H14DRAFT_2583553 [Mycena olivaceomarginata]
MLFNGFTYVSGFIDVYERGLTTFGTVIGTQPAFGFIAKDIGNDTAYFGISAFNDPTLEHNIYSKNGSKTSGIIKGTMFPSDVSKDGTWFEILKGSMVSSLNAEYMVGVDQHQFNAGGTELTFRAVAGHAIPIFINDASSLHILSLHSPIAMAVVIDHDQASFIPFVSMLWDLDDRTCAPACVFNREGRIVIRSSVISWGGTNPTHSIPKEAMALLMQILPLLQPLRSGWGIVDSWKADTECTAGSQNKLALKLHEWFRQVQTAGSQAKLALKSHEMVQGELSELFRQVQAAGSQAKLALKSHEMVQSELSEWFRQSELSEWFRWVQATDSQAKLALKSHEMVQAGSQAKLALKSHEMVQSELSEWFRQVQATGSQAKLALKSHEMVQGELSEWFQHIQTTGSQAKLALKSHEMVQSELSEWFRQVQTAGSQAKLALKSHEMVQSKSKRQPG